MTGVIYARYSSDNQREESIEGQVRECMAFAEKNGITILGHYIDRAFSAKTDNRPDFQKMIRCTGTTYLRNAGKGGTGGGKCGKGPILGGFAAGRPRNRGGMSQLF